MRPFLWNKETALCGPLHSSGPFLQQRGKQGVSSLCGHGPSCCDPQEINVKHLNHGLQPPRSGFITSEELTISLETTLNMLGTPQYSPTDCCRAPGLRHPQNTLQARMINREDKMFPRGGQNQSLRVSRSVTDLSRPMACRASGESKGLLLSQAKCGCNLSTF